MLLWCGAVRLFVDPSIMYTITKTILFMIILFFHTRYISVDAIENELIKYAQNDPFFYGGGRADGVVPDYFCLTSKEGIGQQDTLFIIV